MNLINDIKYFKGQHCESTATGTLLNQIGISLSEPMLFGLGEGLGFIFWKMKTMNFPFIGGRVKTDELTKNICKHLKLNLDVKETSSIKKAWANVKQSLDQNQVVGLKLDCYHLEYFSNPIHFAGHYVAIYGYDEEKAYLVDTQQQGSKVTSSLKNLALARNERGAMSSKNLSYTITGSSKTIDLKKAVKNAIINNAQLHLNPPIKNLGYKGILKTSTEIKKWFKNSTDIKSEFETSAMLMERAGTGGALFRNLYKDFLKESSQILASTALSKVQLEFEKIAKHWTLLSELFLKVSQTSDIQYINDASRLLVELSHKEKAAMESLLTALNK